MHRSYSEFTQELEGKILIGFDVFRTISACSFANTTKKQSTEKHRVVLAIADATNHRFLHQGKRKKANAPIHYAPTSPEIVFAMLLVIYIIGFIHTYRF